MTNVQRFRMIAENQNKVRQLGFHIVDVDPWVPCKIQGRDYKFELSMGAAIELFQKTGITVGVDRVNPQLITEMLPDFLVAGLRTHHSDEFPDTSDDTKKALMNKLPFRHISYYVTVVEAGLAAVEPDQEQIAEITDALTAAMKEGADDGPLAQVVDISVGSGQNAENLESVETSSGA